MLGYSRYVMLVSLAFVLAARVDAQASISETGEVPQYVTSQQMAKTQKTVQSEDAEVQKEYAAYKKELSDDSKIDDEWYKALQDTRQRLRNTKKEYDNFYFYSNFCVAVMLFVLLLKIAQRKFNAEPRNGLPLYMAYQPFLPPSDGTAYQPFLNTNPDDKYDEIQKRWDEKVLSAHGNKIETKYEEIQQRWDQKVLGA
jgi:hypothetical protein